MSYRPVIFNKDPPQSMLKTLSTVIKASHHQAQTQSMEPERLLSVKQEILAQIDTKLLEINRNEPIDIGALENIISNYYNGVINCLLPSFLVYFESAESTWKDFEKSRIDVAKRIRCDTLLGIDDAEERVRRWTEMGTTSLSPLTKGTLTLTDRQQNASNTHHPCWWANGICMVKGKYDPTSNFYPCQIQYQGKVYASSEHAYQCAKLKNAGAPFGVIEFLADQHSAAQAKKMATEFMQHPTWHIRCMKNWAIIKLDVMKEILQLKLVSCQDFKEHLMQTGKSKISHPVRDMFWGNGSESMDTTGSGADYFAILLMQIRDRMQNSWFDPWVIPKNHGNKGSPELKKKEWDLPPLVKKIVILGDSNLAWIPPFQHNSCQVEAFPGAKMYHISHLLKKYEFKENIPQIMVVNVGLNDVTSVSGKIERDLTELIDVLQRNFSTTQIYFVPVQVHSKHRHEIQKAAEIFNSALLSQPGLPPLHRSQFSLEPDKIHWKPHCAKAMMSHWLMTLGKQSC